MNKIEKLLKESSLFLGTMIDAIDDDPKAAQFFDLRIIAGAKKHLIEIDKLSKERGW